MVPKKKGDRLEASSLRPRAALARGATARFDASPAATATPAALLRTVAPPSSAQRRHSIAAPTSDDSSSPLASPSSSSSSSSAPLSQTPGRRAPPVRLLTSLDRPAAVIPSSTSTTSTTNSSSSSSSSSSSFVSLASSHDPSLRPFRSSSPIHVYTSAECFRHGKKKCFECSNDPELVGSDDEPPPPPSDLATPLFRIVKEGIRKKSFYRPTAYINHHDRSQAEWTSVIEYDMDSDDERVMNDLNTPNPRLRHNKLGSCTLNEDQFECIVDQFEKQLLAQRQLHPPPESYFVPPYKPLDFLRQCAQSLLNNSSSASVANTHAPPTVPTSRARTTIDVDSDSDVDSDDGGNSFELAHQDIRCGICGDGDYSDENHIVLCDGCNIAVHQTCYGIPQVPDGDYFCDRCTAKLSESQTQCVLCPDRGGPVKPTDDGRWCHVLCATWMPGVQVLDKTEMKPITGFDDIPREHWRMVCTLCNRRRGACIECSDRLCVKNFHIMCAQRRGLYVSCTNGKKTAFCRRHTLGRWVEEKYRDWDSDLCNKQWRTMVASIAKHPLLTDLPMTAIVAVGQHWLRKRAALCRPLLPRLQVILKDEENNTIDRLLKMKCIRKEEVEELSRLRHCLEKVRILTDLSWVRERKKLQLCETMNLMFETELASVDPALASISTCTTSSSIDGIPSTPTDGKRKRQPPQTPTTPLAFPPSPYSTRHALKKRLFPVAKEASPQPRLLATTCTSSSSTTTTTTPSRPRASSNGTLPVLELDGSPASTYATRSRTVLDADWKEITGKLPPPRPRGNSVARARELAAAMAAAGSSSSSPSSPAFDHGRTSTTTSTKMVVTTTPSRYLGKRSRQRGTSAADNSLLLNGHGNHQHHYGMNGGDQDSSSNDESGPVEYSHAKASRANGHHHQPPSDDDGDDEKDDELCDDDDDQATHAATNGAHYPSDDDDDDDDDDDGRARRRSQKQLYNLRSVPVTSKVQEPLVSPHRSSTAHRHKRRRER